MKNCVLVTDAGWPNSVRLARERGKDSTDLLPLANTISILEKTLVVRDTVLPEDETK